MSITKSQTEKIGSIFNGNKFEIPTYQRKYSWTDTERKALWVDIEESLNDDMNHFIGTLSFKENISVGLSTDTTYEIIDGQQRITTLFILLKVLIDRLENEDTKSSLLSAFIGTESNLKLLPLGDDGKFLKNVLFHFDELVKDDIKKRSQKFLYSAVEVFKALTNTLNATEIENRIIFIRDRIEVLVFNVESQAQAVKMFSIINDRGLPLRILDKTKSIFMLYSTLHLKEKLNHRINEKFEQIFDAYDDILVKKEQLGILGRLEENTIFTHHYYASKNLMPSTWNNRDGAGRIFDNLKTKLDSLKESAEELELFIEAYINDFSAFAIGYKNLLHEIDDNEKLRKPFIFLEFTATLYPLLVRLYNQKKLTPLMDVLEAIEVRVYKLRGTNPIADMYWLSSHVHENDLTIEQISGHLKNFNEKFVNNYVFSSYLENSIYGNGAVKYILSEHCREQHSLEVYKDLQIEHLFSKEPNYEIESYGFKEDYDYEKNRIGNLCLLEKGLNAGLGNLPPINKVSGYLKSKINETRNIGGEIQQGNFSKENVDDRRGDIISFCQERFKVD